MKFFLIIISLFWITGNVFSQSECRKFAKGKFQNIEKGVIKSIIERNDTIQVEQYGDKIIKLKIKWIDECSYRLSFLEGNDAWYKQMGHNRPTPNLIVRITDINDSSYKQESKFVDDEEFMYKSQIEKVE